MAIIIHSIDMGEAIQRELTLQEADYVEARNKMRTAHHGNIRKREANLVRAMHARLAAEVWG